MNTNLRHNSKLRTARSGERRGIVVGVLLLAIVFLSGFLALAVDVAKLRQTKSQLRSTCQAAALAGAAQLLDEGVLYGYPDQSDDILMAREYARVLGYQNPVSTLTVVLDPNKANAPRGDMVVGYLDPLGPVTQTLQLPSTDLPLAVNTLRVNARLSRNAYNKVTLWFGSLIGLTSSDVGASAQATIDRRVCGFRPGTNVRAPLQPLVADYDAWCRQATAAAVAGANDCFMVDPTTNLVTRGSDGIPEIRLLCGSPNAAVEGASESDGATAATGAATGRCLPLVLGNTSVTRGLLWTRAVIGLSRDDLAPYGGEFVLYNPVLTVPVESSIVPDFAYGLMDSVGQSKAWALGEPGASSGSYNVTSFGAGRIVAVLPADDQNTVWEIVIQPSTLVCSQAVTGVNVLPNPWIAKLELTQ
jgi:hypothetical protein